MKILINTIFITLMLLTSAFAQEFCTIDLHVGSVVANEGGSLLLVTAGPNTGSVTPFTAHTLPQIYNNIQFFISGFSIYNSCAVINSYSDGLASGYYQKYTYSRATTTDSQTSFNISESQFVENVNNHFYPPPEPPKPVFNNVSSKLVKLENRFNEFEVSMIEAQYVVAGILLALIFAVTWKG